MKRFIIGILAVVLLTLTTACGTEDIKQTIVGGDDNGNGHAGAPVFNSDGSVDANSVHYPTVTAFCVAELTPRMGGSSDKWSQTKDYYGKPIPASCTLAEKDQPKTRPGDESVDFKGWHLTLLDGTIVHTQVHWFSGSNYESVTAVGPATVHGDFSVGTTTVYWDRHLDAHRGQWTNGLLSVKDDGTWYTWMEVSKSMPTNEGGYPSLFGVTLAPSMVRADCNYCSGPARFKSNFNQSAVDFLQGSPENFKLRGLDAYWDVSYDVQTTDRGRLTGLASTVGAPLNNVTSGHFELVRGNHDPAPPKAPQVTAPHIAQFCNDYTAAQWAQFKAQYDAEKTPVVRGLIAVFGSPQGTPQDCTAVLQVSAQQFGSQYVGRCNALDEAINPTIDDYNTGKDAKTVDAMYEAVKADAKLTCRSLAN